MIQQLFSMFYLLLRIKHAVLVPRTVYDSPANRSRPVRLPAVLFGDGVALLLLKDNERHLVRGQRSNNDLSKYMWKNYEVKQPMRLYRIDDAADEKKKKKL